MDFSKIYLDHFKSLTTTASQKKDCIIYLKDLLYLLEQIPKQEPLTKMKNGSLHYRISDPKKFPTEFLDKSTLSHAELEALKNCEISLYVPKEDVLKHKTQDELDILWFYPNCLHIE